MDSSNSLFSKFTKLRKKHQQPLTDLTELYSKIANETIYYKKLENSKNYNEALQGWKALTTDALFRLTTINYTYPNTENYTVDELSILSGIRELYHKAQIHLDDLQKMLKDNPDLSSKTDVKNKHCKTSIPYHSKIYKNSLNRFQTTISAPSSSSSTTSSRGLSMTTLRKNGGGLDRGQHSHSSSDYFNTSWHNHDVKVNFTNSKPLDNHFVHNNSFKSIGNDNQSSISTFSNETNPFKNFEDIGDDDENYDDYETENRCNMSPGLIVIDSDDDSPENSFGNADPPHISVLEEDSNNIPSNQTDINGDETNYNTNSDSEDLDFDVSEYYEDNYEPMENQNEKSLYNQDSGSTSVSSLVDTQDEYLYLDEEDKARLQALEKLNGSSNKPAHLSNDQLTRDLSHFCISPSKLSGNNKDNKETNTELDPFIPPLPEKLPPPLPQLPRVPVIIPARIMPEIKPQRHNLLNKNMVKNVSSPSISTTTSTQQKSSQHINIESSTGKRPTTQLNKSTPVVPITSSSHSSSVTTKKSTTQKSIPKSNKGTPAKLSSSSSKPPIKKKLVSHSKLNVTSDRTKSNVSASQVAKLVYKTSTRSDGSISSKKQNLSTSSNKSVMEDGKKKMILNKKIDTNKKVSTTRKVDPIKHNKVMTSTKKSKLGSSAGSKLHDHSNIKYMVSNSETKNKSSSLTSFKSRTMSPPVTRTAGQSSKSTNSSVGSTRSKEFSKNYDVDDDDERIANDLKLDTSQVDGENKNENEDEYDKILKTIPNIDKLLGKQILQDIVVHGDEVHWDDIAGLNSAKNSLKEAVVYPFLRPDLFMGLRQPVTGMLLFGPPGTGKTMLARAVACESKSTFFSISASSLTSKYLGESEKLVRALFTIARKLSPSIIFVDEIDSILGNRNQDGENESSRRIKNEFLVQWSALSNAAAGKDDKRGSKFIDDKRVLVLAATNLPWSIDEAARRRFVRRQYIPLPEDETRLVQIKKLLAHQNHTLTDEDFNILIELTRGYSGSDITSLAKDAAMGPLRELGDQLLHTERENIRPIELKDFKNSLEYIKPSVSKEGLAKYEEWASQFGSSGT